MKFLSAILVLAALSGCEEKSLQARIRESKTSAALLALNAYIPPARGLPQGGWRVTHVDGRPFEGGRVEFDKAQVSRSGGCNGGYGDYVAHPDGHIEVKGLSGTLMACEDADGGASGMNLDELVGLRLVRATRFRLLTPDDLLLTTSDNRSLRMARLPKPPRSVEGDWALLGTKWDPDAPRPMARFHRGHYQDAVGCVGRYWHGFGVLHLKLAKTPACVGGALTPGFHRIWSSYYGLVLLRPDVNGVMTLAPLSNWELTPRDRWTLEGVWYGYIDQRDGIARKRVNYRLAFTDGQVTQWGTCQGAFKQSADRLTLAFPRTKACSTPPKPPTWPERAQLPPGETTATVQMRSYGEARLFLADGRVLWIHRTEPKERRPSPAERP
uniref:META domain-containing protein n=1 Tax=uncultured Caulobacter sp. TaxID=158749 RepID=UPI0025D5AABB|nr:META domain-containing protein [uncultured Caulobacter sp.]